MQVLVDECIPKRLDRHVTGHAVRTVHDMGWTGKKNGELLKLMKANGFEALLTVDQNLRHQQNLAVTGVAIVVLIAPTNRLVHLLPLVPSVLAALASIRPGDVVEIST